MHGIDRMESVTHYVHVLTKYLVIVITTISSLFYKQSISEENGSNFFWFQTFDILRYDFEKKKEGHQ